ncbi:MAG: hypothetical protein JWO82_2220 [Akkermansiaceae bacterium]|nr:hypothetical protein [Akkermansiaceae bacterium]
MSAFTRLNSQATDRHDAITHELQQKSPDTFIDWIDLPGCRDILIAAFHPERPSFKSEVEEFIENAGRRKVSPACRADL